jgi:hypothetical protein
LLSLHYPEQPSNSVLAHISNDYLIKSLHPWVEFGKLLDKPREKNLMFKIVCFFLTCLCLTYGTPFALEITSVSPNRGTPGTLVSIGGGPFTLQTQIFLGEQFVPSLQVQTTRVEFATPYLPAGNYTLTVQDQRSVATTSSMFEVLAPKPQVTDISPRNLEVCPIGSDKKLEITGRNFLQGADVLINNSAVPTNFIAPNRIEAVFQGPQSPGVYGVSVRNPDGAMSLPHSVWFNNIPTITDVDRGAEFENYYEVIIRGKNFSSNSTLLVKEPADSSFGVSYRQIAVVARQSESSQVANISSSQGDRIVFVNCQTMIYYRYPSHSQNKDLGFQIINPDGQATDLIYTSLP